MKKLFASLMAAAAATLLALAAERVGIARVFGLKALDRQFAASADPARVSPRIILVEVDQQSLDHFERDNIAFPWPRSMYNPIIEYAAAGGARAVLFDILFNNLSPYGLEVDDEFAAAIVRSGVTGLAGAFGSTGSLTPAAGEAQTLGLPFTGAAPPALVKRRASLPLRAIREAAAGIGSVIFLPDPDGVYRRVPPGAVFGGRFIPALYALPVFRGAASVAFEPGMIVADNGRRIPLDAEGAMLINFLGPRGAYKSYPAAAVISSALMAARGMAPAIPKEAFKDAVVIIGYTAPGLYDLKPNPLSAVSPGIEIYAAALDTIESGRHLAVAGAGLVSALSFAGALAAALAALFVPSWAALVATAAAGGGLYAYTFHAFAGGVWINQVTLLSALALGLLGGAVARYQMEGRQKRAIQRAFSYYVSPKVVAQMLAEPERLTLGGEKRKLTVLFADLEGFTSLSEAMEPRALVAALNEYTTLSADIIMRYDGTLDKYIGDAVMAFWGAPLDQDDQAARALLAALELQRGMVRLRQSLTERGLPPVSARVGVNLGECVVGNMGSAQRFDYTALGDAVNLASRLEGLTRVYGVAILAAEPAWAEARDHVFAREIDYLIVKGKGKPIRVYEIMARKGEETRAQQELAVRYESALAAYRARNWDDALGLCEGLVREYEDGPARVIAGRCRAFRDAPPPPDWDGAFKHTAK
ncbi:MAG: adenylate/guanylate cyclase domain-containing protein [Nitrospinae bacterium]|nr:adenylate/guanylate cyclase domain-containing protein [Nitrospinota bacterium]